jgi:virulence factor Mce-like protein
MKKSRTFKNALIIIGFTVLCLAGMEFLAVNIGQGVPFQNGYRVHAAFSDADGVPTAADIRVSGVDVGKVVDVTHDPAYPGETIVTMEINDPRAVPVFTNGYAKVKPKTLLGEKFIDLTIGNAATAEPIAAGGFLPLAQTGKDVSNDEIFNAFDATTRQQQQQVLQALDAATQQRAGDIQAILPQLSTVFANLNPLARVYEQDQPQVDHIFVQLNTIMATIADEHQQLAGVLANGSSVLGAIAAKDQALLTTLEEIGTVASQFNSAMAPTIASQQAAINELGPALSPSCTGGGANQSCGQNAFLNQIVFPQAACHNRPCGIDEVFTGTLTGNINYPNDQLTVTSSTGTLITEEWDSMFSQPSGAGQQHALNIVLSFHCDAVNTTIAGLLPTNPPLGSAAQVLLQTLLNLEQQLGIKC